MRFEKTTGTAAQSKRSDALLVLGMHRSGTSATTRVLNLLGAELGENLMGPGYSNDHGFWEHMEAFQINDRLLGALGMTWNDPRRMPSGWQETAEFTRALREIVVLLERDFAGAPLWAVKDPRICRLVPLWLKALENQKVVGRAVIVLRHPDEIADSLAVRDGLSRSQIHLLWARHLCEAERATRGMPRCVIRYDQMLKDWRSELAQAGRALGLKWPVAFDEAAQQIDGFLHRGSRHHIVEQDALAPTDVHTPWIDLAYRIFAAVPEGNDWTLASALVDEFERAIRVGDAYLDETRTQLDALAADRARFDNTAALVHSVHQGVGAALVESEVRTLAGLTERVAESEAKMLAGLTERVAESEARTAAGLSASLETTVGVISERTHAILKSVQDDARMRQEREAAAWARMTKETILQAERSEELIEQVDQLTQLVSSRSQELDALHADITRLHMQLDASRLEVQRQQHTYATTYAELNERMEAVSACASLQAALIWSREQDVAALTGELGSAKQCLDEVTRLANSLDNRLKHATRPWYKKLMQGKYTNESGEAS